MIPKKARDGDNTARLLEYLYGPGKRDEHKDPHMVAAWNPYVEDPAKPGTMTIADLAMLLDAPVHALTGRKPLKHVYHVAVRNEATDRRLSDEEWAEVAAEMMHAAGIAPHGDDQGARWVAIRHADDHIHIVATRARQDGRQPNLRRDWVRMQAAARKFEIRFGLVRLASGDKTARVWSTTGESEKARKRGLPETVRETLQRMVREAAAGATSDEDFFARLGAVGVRVRLRIAPDGRTTGYSVALPGDRDRVRTAVWFPGTKLAPDLSLPRVRERWMPGVVGEPASASPEMWRIAAAKVRSASAVLGAGGLHRGAGDVAALGDLVVAAAATAPVLVRDRMRSAAREFERASRAPGARNLEGESRRLYLSSSRTLASAAAAVGRNDTAAMLGFLLALVEALESSRRWHQAQQHRAQELAAARAGRLLREAVEITAGAAAREARPRVGRAPVANSRRTGSPRAAAGSSRPEERLMMPAVQAALPGRAGEILADPAWPALRARLAAVEQSGEDPGEVLAAVAARRELGTADSVAEVLTWRLDGWMRNRKHLGPVVSDHAGHGTPGGAAPTAPPRGAAAAPTRKQPPGDDPHTSTPRRGR